MANELERRPRWTRAHFWIPAALLAVFALLTFLFADRCLADGRSHARLVAWTTLATPLGPITGAISRDGQASCVAFAWSIARVTGPILAAGIALQFVLRAPGRGWDRARLAIWSLAWFVWLSSGIVSLGYSLE